MDTFRSEGDYRAACCPESWIELGHVSCSVYTHADEHNWRHRMEPERGREGLGTWFWDCGHVFDCHYALVRNPKESENLKVNLDLPGYFGYTFLKV